jgi:hypothetical protein
MTTCTLAAPPKVQWQGWRKNLPDFRDRNYAFRRMLAGEILNVEDVPLESAPQAKEVAAHGVRNQGPAGSCVGHAFGLAASVERNVKPRSPLWIYSQARMKQGELSVDLGAYPRDAAMVVREMGAPVDSKWPYRIVGDTVANLFVEPSIASDKDAEKRKLFTFHELNGRLELVSCLSDTKTKRGHLVTFGTTVFANWSQPIVDKFGLIQMPAGADDGGHELPIIGHNFNFKQSAYAQKCRNAGVPESAIFNEVYKVQNSWDYDWGDEGCGYIPAAIVESQLYSGDWITLRGFSNENR